MNAPTIGRKYRATTATPAAQAVVVEVTAVERETASGWYVWGYRQYRTRRRHATSFPSLYLIARPTNRKEI